ncbi:class E sortase [Candidatus Peregrinibacteria bacterium]|jgi:LPXTG-site transpeptidase (sortase) family protein|nr:class E sortase [Candidatus Peregrinibacteria bacterium]
MTEQDHFQLHIGPEDKKTEPHKRHDKPSVKPHSKPKKETKMQEVLKNAGRQVGVTLVILVVAFLAMNWRAYYQIASNEIDKLMGVEPEPTLTELVEIDKEVEQKLLKTDESTMARVRTIPDINLEIAPPDTRLIIPRISQNLPVLRVSSQNLINHDWDALEEDIQNKLKDGVIHYPGTSFPDQGGNTVITGHSSYFPWDPGRFKDVFALLNDVVVGDKIAMYYDQTKYVYEISEKIVVLPSQIDILKQPSQKDENKLTLITCTPVGTNLKRLVVIGDLVATE